MLPVEPANAALISSERPASEIPHWTMPLPVSQDLHQTGSPKQLVVLILLENITRS